MRGPRAESAHYDAGRNRVIVRLTTGVEIDFAPRDVEGLQHASTDDLKAIAVDAFGLGIHFPTIDADLYVPALLEGVLGSKRWMAAQLGAAGGRTRTPAKAAASRENGKRAVGRARLPPPARLITGVEYLLRLARRSRAQAEGAMLKHVICRTPFDAGIAVALAGLEDCTPRRRAA